jgi:hypothetical protein
MDHARDAGEICALLLCASNELESAVALCGSAATSLCVVSTNFDMKSPNPGSAVNGRSQNIPSVQRIQESKYMKQSLLARPWVVYQVDGDMILRNRTSSLGR